MHNSNREQHEISVNSFVEGLLLYIALQLGDKDDLMQFLKVWGEKERVQMTKHGRSDDDRKTI